MRDSAKLRLKTVQDHLKESTSHHQSVHDSDCHTEIAQPTKKVATAEEAVSKIKDGVILTTGGFVGAGSPEHLFKALRSRFDRTAKPRDIHLVVVASTGDRKGRGMDVLAAEGLLAKYTFGWTGNCPSFIQLMKEDKIEAWNLPLGAVSHMIRANAGGNEGMLSQIGLDTFVDPRQQGGRVNSRTKDDIIKLVNVDGKQALWYKVPQISVALLRATTADTVGNVSFEREVFQADALNQAMAAHRNGGLVIVQVERVVEANTIPCRMVHIPGVLVNQVVVAPPEEHWQSFLSPESDASLTGEIKRPLGSLPALPLDARKIIAHRCMLAIKTPQAMINLGVGMPEAVAVVFNTHGKRDRPELLPVTLSTEVGLVGGMPAGGMQFGAAHNADSVMPCSTMIDLIHGGRLDATVLGCAEVDEAGNVNVSRFSDRQPGCGGFIDISHSAKQVMFAGTFTSGGLKVEVRDGQLSIVQEGRLRKFRRKVQERTFAGSTGTGREILYVTERCVFRLTRDGASTKIQLIEIAPGIRLQEDILHHMDFTPVVRNVKTMNPRCFEP